MTRLYYCAVFCILLYFLPFRPKMSSLASCTPNTLKHCSSLCDRLIFTHVQINRKFVVRLILQSSTKIRQVVSEFRYTVNENSSILGQCPARDMPVFRSSKTTFVRTLHRSVENKTSTKPANIILLK